MAARYDVIVIGVGAMGAATCRELARRGAKVLGLDQAGIPNQRSSHHGGTRMIRTAYFEHPDYVALLQRAWEGWRRLEADTDRRLLFQTGGLYLGAESSELVSGSLAAARQHGLAHELLDASELRRRHPLFRVPGEWVGFLEEQAGFLLAEASVEALAGDAMRSGAVLDGTDGARSWRADDAGVTVQTGSGSYVADELVLTAGAWTRTLVPALGVELTVTRQELFWFEPLAVDRFQLGDLPVWALEPGPEEPGLLYGFPMTEEAGTGFKAAWHRPGPATDPDLDRETPSEEAAQPVLQSLRRYVPDGAGRLLRSSACLYTSSPDSHFVVGLHPGHANVALACGFSGHGFKFAPVMGEILADLVLEGRTGLPAQFLSAFRFCR